MLYLKFKSEERINVEVAYSKEKNKSKGKRSEKLLKISREQARKHVLDQFKYVKTCILARELCLLIRTHRAVLEKEDVHACCSFISKLCLETVCEEASECAKAAEAVLGSEEEYLELCEQSCKKCSESRLPKRLPSDRAAYVA